MSHSKERKEKICLNCSAELNGRFCHMCGQENLEPKESVWSLISHFFYDITHFDGKFFSTLGFLLRKPGFLSREYMRGRRASYLNPIRMYVFSSALFFLIFFSMYDVRNWKIGSESKSPKTEQEIINYEREEALEDAENSIDSTRIKAFFDALGGHDSLAIITSLDSLRKSRKGWTVKSSAFPYRTRQQYDSAQLAKSPGMRDGWLSRKLNYRFIDLSERYVGTESTFIKDLLDKFLHTFPYLLFVSLPLYALYLKLLYVRRKQFYYVDHGIFLVHLYIFTFIILLIIFAIAKLTDVSGWNWLWLLQGILIIYGVLYTMKAMKNFYGQGWAKTFVKFVLLNILALFTLILLFFIFFIFAAFRV